MTAVARELDYPDQGAHSRLESIKGYTDGVEALLAQINTALAPLSTEAKLEAVRALIASAEAARDSDAATIEAKFTDLLARLGVANTTPELNTVIELLQRIDRNTDTLELTANNISLNADSIDLNTDNVEALLTALSANTGTTSDPTSAQTLVGRVKRAVEVLEGEDFASETTIARKYGGGKTTRAAQVSAAGDSPLITPSVGKRVRLLWIGMSTSENNAGEVLVLVKFGVNVHYRWNLGAPGGFSHWEVVEGAVDQPLVVNLSQPFPVEFNYTYQEF